MATAEELQALIDAERQRGRLLDDEHARIQDETVAARERQRLRRILDELRRQNDIKAVDNHCEDLARQQVDGSAADVSSYPVRTPESLHRGYVQKEGDIANCRFNVFKKEHIWKIEGMSWLKSALKQAGDIHARSSLIQVGPVGAIERFILRYNPYGIGDDEIQPYKCFYQGHVHDQVGSLVIIHIGEGITFRYRFFIQGASGEFVQWGDVGDICDPDSWSCEAYGPDVQNSDLPVAPFGIMGLSHDELLESEWVVDDTLTMRVELEVRTDEKYGAKDYINLQVDVPQPEIISNLRGCLTSGKYSDVTFIVDGEQIQAHSLILCLRSEVLERLLTAGMRESLEKVVVIDQCDPTIFKALLEFLYTDEFTGIETLLHESSSSLGFSDKRVSLLQNMLAVSNRYQVTRLQLWCEQQLCDSLSVNEVCSVLCQASLHEARQLERACLNFIKAHIAEVVATPEFGRLSAEWPEVMLKINIANAGIDEVQASAAKCECSAALCKIRREAKWNDYDYESACEISPSTAETGTCDVSVRHDRIDSNFGACRSSISEDDHFTFADVGGSSEWIEHRVFHAWSGPTYDDEYLQIQENEILRVRPELVDGWAFGCSMSTGRSGWFPPSYASAG